MSEPANLTALSPAEQKIVAETIERHKVSADFGRPFRDKMLLAWRARHNQLPMAWPFWSTIYEPETATAITETVEATMAALFGKDNYFDLRPVQGQDALRCEKTKQVMRFCLRREEYQYKLQKYRQTMDSTTYGNGVVFHFIDMLVRENFARVPLVDEYGVPAGYQEQRAQRVEFWPAERVISPFDCYEGPTGADIQAMPYFQHTELVPLAWLKAQGNRFRNVDRLSSFLLLDKAKGRVGITDEDLAFDLFDRLKAVGFDVKEGLGQGGDGGGAVEYCELLYETLAPPTGRGGASWRIIGNRSVPLLDEPLPFWLKRKPYSDVKYLERSGQLWRGMGLPELLEPLQNKLNIHSNQANDTILLNSHPMQTVEEGTLVEDDLTLLQHWPDRVIRVTKSDGIKTLNKPQVGADLWTDMGLTRASMQRIAKLFDATRNAGGGRGSGMGDAAKTATGMAIFRDMMAAGTAFKILWMDETGFADGLRITLGHLQQVLTQEQRLRIEDLSNPVFAAAGIGEDGMLTVTPEDVNGEYDIVPVGSSRASQDSEQLAAEVDWLKQGLGLPDVAAKVKQEDVWLALGERLNIRFPRQYLRNPQEQQEYMLRKLQEQQAVAAMMPAPVPGGGA